MRMDGDGVPTVVTLPGAGLIGLDFLNIHERAAKLTRSVLYDRAGTGWGAPADLPRTPTAVVTELHDLLRDVPGPYVFVGHSLGGLYARRYAQLFPDEVAGLLLLDPGHEDMYSYLPPEAAAMNERIKQGASDITDEQVAAARPALEALHKDWPDADRAALVDYHLTHWRTALAESANFETEVFDELRGGGPLPAVPTIVLSAGGANPMWSQADPELVRQAQDGLRRMHADLAGPDGEHRVVAGVSHQYLHIENPDAVMDALRNLLQG